MNKSDEVVGVKVKAIGLGSAEGVSVGEYEKALEERKQGIEPPKKDHEDIT